MSRANVSSHHGHFSFDFRLVCRKGAGNAECQLSILVVLTTPTLNFGVAIMWL